MSVFGELSFTISPSISPTKPGLNWPGTILTFAKSGMVRVFFGSCAPTRTVISSDAAGSCVRSPNESP